MQLDCKNTDKPTRYIIPFTETPSDISKAPSHAILMIIDYDPKEKKLMPVVYDSIGRGTTPDLISSLLKSKTRSTSDEILSQKILDIMEGAESSDIKVEPLKRIAYNHQNRATEGNCGSYTFRSIYEAIRTGINGKTLEIPSAGIISSSSYLTSEHVKEIEQCVNFRTLTPEQIDTRFLELNPEKPIEKPNSKMKLIELVEALKAYVNDRSIKPEKGLLNLTGYSKISKINAATSLSEIISLMKNDEKVPAIKYEQLFNHQATLENGGLGRLINYFAQRMEHKDIYQLISKQVTFEDEFVLIDDHSQSFEDEVVVDKKLKLTEEDGFDLISKEEDLFEVPEVETGTLATQEKPSPIKSVESSMDASQRLKKSLKILKEEEREEQEDLLRKDPVTIKTC